MAALSQYTPVRPTDCRIGNSAAGLGQLPGGKLTAAIGVKKMTLPGELAVKCQARRNAGLHQVGALVIIDGPAQDIPPV